MKNLYAGLLFMHGHIQDPELAVSLAGTEAEVEATQPRTRQEAAPREIVAKKAARGPRAWFRSHAVSSICCTTALSPFR
ncbi:MAG TPA: hypothetical protein VGD42_11875 [Lysobacter sp.]